MAELIFVTVPGTPRVPLPEQGITFGRAPDCDLPIEEGSVSSHHGSIRPERGGWWLHDNNSSNGTFVNGQRVQDAEIHSGDELRFGDLVVMLRSNTRPGNAICSMRRHFHRLPEKGGRDR